MFPCSARAYISCLTNNKFLKQKNKNRFQQKISHRHSYANAAKSLAAFAPGWRKRWRMKYDETMHFNQMMKKLIDTMFLASQYYDHSDGSCYPSNQGLEKNPPYL